MRREQWLIVHSWEQLMTCFMNWGMRAHNQQVLQFRTSMSKFSCEHIVLAHVFKFRCIGTSRRNKILF